MGWIDKNGKGSREICSQEMDGERLAASPRAAPGVWPLWVARGKSARLCRASHGQGFGRCIEESCSSSFLASEEGSTASVLALGCRFTGQKRWHYSCPDYFVTGLGTFVIEQPFRTATAFPDGFEQVAPGDQAMIGSIKHPTANERAAHEPQKIGALDDKRFDLDCHLATSS